MADSPRTERKLRTNAGAYRFVAWFGLAYVFQNAWQSSNWLGPLRGLAWRLEQNDSPYATAVDLFFHWCSSLLPVYSTLLIVATVGAAVTFVARTFRRSPPGTPRDPLILLRDWLRRHARVRTFLPWSPYLLLLALAPHSVARDMAYAAAHGYGLTGVMWNAILPFADMLTVVAAGKLGLRLLDHLSDRTIEAPSAVEGNEIAFRAVAVTARTRALVLAATMASVAMLLVVANAGPSLLFSAKMGAGMAAYAAALLGLANWFRQESNIAVGVDGVLVTGTSKTKFYGYRDFDSVRVYGATMALVRGDKTLVRLQLHGDDITRGEVLAERIRRALELSKSTSSAEMLATSVRSGAESGLGRAAIGAADYRQASLSREQLWELVEGDGTNGAARSAAAEALAFRLDPSERQRLRIAASHCADPNVRVAIEDLAEDEEVAPGGAAAAALRL